MNNVKNSIGWCDYTINPIVGCKRNCWYCSSRRIFTRFCKKIWRLNKCDFTNISFYQKVLQDKKLSRIPPSKIFLGIMTDNEYWPLEWWMIILNFCREYPQHTFMLLSKSIIGYARIPLKLQWPSNIWQGLTIGQYTSEEYLKVAKLSHYPNPFLSVEPLSGPFNRRLLDEFKLVIVGAMTQMEKQNVIPKPMWLESIKKNVDPKKIFYKENIRKWL